MYVRLVYNFAIVRCVSIRVHVRTIVTATVTTIASTATATAAAKAAAAGLCAQRGIAPVANALGALLLTTLAIF